MLDRFAKSGFAEALVLTLVVASILLFATWKLASPPVLPDREELAGQVDFLSGELQALKERRSPETGAMTLEIFMECLLPFWQA